MMRTAARFLQSSNSAKTPASKHGPLGAQWDIQRHLGFRLLHHGTRALPAINKTEVRINYGSSIGILKKFETGKNITTS